jgi:hypothetical protein
MPRTDLCYLREAEKGYLEHDNETEREDKAPCDRDIATKAPK